MGQLPDAGRGRRGAPHELSEFGYRETDEADRRRFYKVEKWDAGEQRVEVLL